MYDVYVVLLLYGVFLCHAMANSAPPLAVSKLLYEDVRSQPLVYIVQGGGRNPQTRKFVGRHKKEKECFHLIILSPTVRVRGLLPALTLERILG